MTRASTHQSYNMDPTLSFKSFNTHNNDWENRKTLNNTDLAGIKVDQKVEVQYEIGNFGDLEMNDIGRSPSAFDLEFTRPKAVKRYD